MLGLKFALSAAQQGFRVGIYSGEMSVEAVQKRAIMLNKAGRAITDSESINEMIDKNMVIKIITHDQLHRRANVLDLNAMILKDKLDFLFVDQLSLMDDVRDKVYDTRSKFNNISGDLFGLSNKFKIPIILAVQSNRDGGLQKDAPQLENIAESDAVGQNATRVIGMRREGDIVTMNISKNRYGDDKFMQKYVTDFTIGKFTPIITAEMPQQGQAQAGRRLSGRSNF